MRAFAALLDGLAYTQSRNRKMALLARYCHDAPDPDRGWALAALTNGVPARLALRRALLDLAGRAIDPVLYGLCRDYIGDTVETVALLWPDCHAGDTDLRLHEVIAAMTASPPSQSIKTLGQFLDILDTSGRWALLQLLGGTPRVGVSARLVRTSLAESFGRNVAEIEELWHALAPPYVGLFAWLEGRADKPDTQGKPVFRPVMLAQAIGEGDLAKLRPCEFAAEWKWDGMRVQIAANGGDVRMFSRQGDDISDIFPEIVSSFLSHNCVVDGELLVMRAGAIASFSDLQQRLNRKRVTAKMREAYPAHVRLYDLLIEGEEDMRTLAFIERRKRLEDWYRKHRPSLTDLSALIAFSNFGDLKTLWSAAHTDGIEGLMLKHKHGAYLAGRVEGQWCKWKRAALTLDCVLMYAQRGSGKLSSFYADYTFGVWRRVKGANLELVPVGKAEAEFTAKEMHRLDQWIRTHTKQKFGPIRAVEAAIVLEIAFDAIRPSPRRKSGVAMRLARIHRIRWDKPAADADTLESVIELMPSSGPRSR
jgi:DNA ligase 1